MIPTLTQMRKMMPASLGQILLLLLTVLSLLTIKVPAQSTETQKKSQAAAHCDQHKNMSMGARQPAQAGTERPAIPDTPVVDQNGKRLNFYTDLVKGKVVAINFIFTTCTTICPPLGATFAKVGALGGERFGTDFHLISISVDPATDTSQTLKAFANKYNARPGWHFLTGKKENLDFAIRKLGLYVDTREDHYTVMLIGNDRTNLWKKAPGMARADALIEIIESVLNDQPAKAQ